ncbi:efflux RND transporter periplasmic adaptor subunit [Sphaerisporangium album]|uniref:efflux RND transporter periplasmic adaptor subunit n=1 Tax=Sphaerisporangium album TaxID=509200 RepID=UPI0015F0E01C|nr:efflux RND transporter periplasmic adaptor subunit [Sphaerisporangium album]
MRSSTPPTAVRVGGLTLAAIVLVGAGLVYAGSGEDAPAARVELASAKRGTVVSAVSAAGNTVDAHSRDLAFGASGTVEKVYVKPGDRVKKGQVLARVDDTIAQEDHDAAKAALAAAEETLDNIENGKTASGAPLISGSGAGSGSGTGSGGGAAGGGGGAAGGAGGSGGSGGSGGGKPTGPQGQPSSPPSGPTTTCPPATPSPTPTPSVPDGDNGHFGYTVKPRPPVVPVSYENAASSGTGNGTPHTSPGPNPTATAKPTVKPTSKPSAKPTSKPTTKPTSKPTTKPTSKPTVRPTTSPTAKPTVKPPQKPTVKPTTKPTAKPTVKPTAKPTGGCPAPDGNGGKNPTQQPTQQPNRQQTTPQGSGGQGGRSGNGQGGQAPQAGGQAGQGGAGGQGGQGGQQVTTVAEAEANVGKAQTALRTAEDALAGVKIKAPASGTVLSVTGTAGSDATAGATFLTLGDLDELQVKAMFSQTDVGRLKIGQRASVTLVTRQDAAYDGKVTHIDPTATTTGRLVQYGVTVAFDHPPKGLMLGQTATVMVTVDKADEAIYVPAQAVRTRSDGMATVVVRQGNGSVPREVTTGVRGDQYIEIRSGLSAGDQIELPSTGPSTFPTDGFPSP